jgi:hypothetical protein
MMVKIEPETRYLLKRASEEARRAISSEQPEAADVHEALSVRYSAQALIKLVEDDPGTDAAAAQEKADITSS